MQKIVHLDEAKKLKTKESGLELHRKGKLA